MTIALWIKDELKRNYVRAAEAGREAALSEPRARSACYDPERNLVVVHLANGCEFAFPPQLAQGLEKAAPAMLAEVEVTPGGYGLHWEKLDADLSVPHLVVGIFGGKAWMRELARRGGAVTSKAKARAARKNGRLGGRPPKKKQPIQRKVHTQLQVQAAKRRSKPSATKQRIAR